MPFPLQDIANQNFQQGSDYLKSVANQARKAYCGYLAVDNAIPDVANLIPAPLKALQQEFQRSVCELPQDPVALPPAQRSPSNSGSCECQYYRVITKLRNGNQELGTDDRNVRGPISLGRRQSGSGASAQKILTMTVRNGGFSSCEPGTKVIDLIVAAGTGDPIGTILSITPIDANSNPVADCVRPTLPTDRTSPRNPPPAPTINIPVPNLPDINIPVIPLPLPVLPGVEFKPQINIDVGGINIKFDAGGVDFSFSPTITAPVTIFPPGYGQPALPPSVQPIPPAGGRDCCDILIANQATISGQIEVVRARVVDIQNTTRDIERVQNSSVVPLLQDIQECACLPESELFATFTNIQGYTNNGLPNRVVYAVVNIITGADIKKTFSVPGGVEVNIVGWFSFGREGRWLPREPLHYKSNLCVAPGREYTDFTFSVYNGASASGTLYREKPRT